MAAEDFFMTVEEANDRLPLVRAIVRDAVGLKRDVLARQDRLLELRERYPDENNEDSSYSEEVMQMEESLEADEIRIDEYIQELQQIGAVLTDAEAGLVEFASSLGGDRVWLSWMYDEPGVSFWRAADDQPAERRPLEPAGQTN
ncbi:MAG: DUF2203 domain-containing protein [Planctomycetaceae bacterium]